MAPMKRTRVQVDASEAKKAKVTDPTTEKIEAITSTLSNPECQVPGTESHREMLLASVSHTLTVPCDERHVFQTALAQMVGTVLRAWVVDQEARVSNAQAKVEMTEQLGDRSMKELEESASRLEYQEQEVVRCREVLLGSREALKTAQEAREVATKEVADFDANLQETIDQRDECSSVYNECFALLKSGCSDHKVFMKRIEPMLKKLGTEGSLLSAIAPALKKSPEARGPFDVMAVEGVEALFTKHLATSQEQIDKADVLKAEKVAGQVAAQEAEIATLSKKTGSKAVLKEEKQVQRLMEMQHEGRFQDGNSRSTIAMQAVADHGLAEEGLLKAWQVLSGFTELLEGQPEVAPAAEVLQGQPEMPPAADVEMSKMEEAPEAKVDDTFEPLSMPSPTKSRAAKVDGLFAPPCMASPMKSVVA